MAAEVVLEGQEGIEGRHTHRNNGMPAAKVTEGGNEVARKEG